MNHIMFFFLLCSTFRPSALLNANFFSETVKENAQALPADEKRAALLLPHVRGDDAKVTVALSTTQSNAGAQPHPLGNFGS